MSIVTLVSQLSYSEDVPTMDELFNRQKNMKIGCLVEVLDESDRVHGIPRTIGNKYLKKEAVTQNCKINGNISPDIHNDCQYILDDEFRSLDQKTSFKVKAKFVTTAIVNPSSPVKMSIKLHPSMYFNLNSDSNYTKTESKNIHLDTTQAKYEMDSIHIVSEGMGIKWSCSLTEE